jgi:hypothetical protein
VAFVRLGGDADGLETETQEWVTELLSPESKRLKHLMVGHRIILDTAAPGLSTFTWCKVLLSCIADAVEGKVFSTVLFRLEILMISHIPIPAAQYAYKAGILHRDLSAGNIMIVKAKETQEWGGILIDLGYVPTVEE